MPLKEVFHRVFEIKHTLWSRRALLANASARTKTRLYFCARPICIYLGVCGGRISRGRTDTEEKDVLFFILACDHRKAPDSAGLGRRLERWREDNNAPPFPRAVLALVCTRKGFIPPSLSLFDSERTRRVNTRDIIIVFHHTSRNHFCLPREIELQPATTN